MPPQRLTLVLVGQTGNGKSATANSLLGRDAFAAKRSFASVTERCARNVSWLDEDDALLRSASADLDAAGSVNEDVDRRRTELCVIDTPGTCDSGALLEDNLAHISAHLRGEDAGATASDEAEAFTIRKEETSTPNANERTSNAEHRTPPAGPPGEQKSLKSLEPTRVHAFILVLSAAARFTQEEAVALERLVVRLGKDALRHSCVAVTRAEEVVRDEDDKDDKDAGDARTVAAFSLARSAPPGLRRLMERMPYHARGAPPVLVENFPSDAFFEKRVAENETRDENETKTTRRFRAAGAPLLAAAFDICDAVAAERGIFSADGRRDLAACAYEPEQLARANAAAASDPSTAALAMLDRLKRQLAEGAFGGADARDPNGMAAAARRAFEDLSAQFAARAGGGPGGERAFAPAAATDREEEAARSVSRFGGLFGGARDSAARSSRSARPETAFGGAAALAGVFDDDAFLPRKGKGEKTTTNGSSGGVTVRVSGSGEVMDDARGAFVVGETGGRLLFAAKASPFLANEVSPRSSGEEEVSFKNLSKTTIEGDGGRTDAGRVRVAGRLSCVGGGFAFAVAGERHAVTMHSPAFLSSVGGSSKTFRATRPISDDDWVEENAHFVTLRAVRSGEEDPRADGAADTRADSDSDSDSVRVVVRGGAAGETPDVSLFLEANARVELQGGSLSVWNAAVSVRFDDPPRGTVEPHEPPAVETTEDPTKNRHSLAFDGALDVASGLAFEFGAACVPARRVAFRPRQTWPWRTAEDGAR